MARGTLAVSSVVCVAFADSMTGIANLPLGAAPPTRAMVHDPPPYPPPTHRRFAPRPGEDAYWDRVAREGGRAMRSGLFSMGEHPGRLPRDAYDEDLREI